MRLNGRLARLEAACVAPERCNGGITEIVVVAVQDANGRPSDPAFVPETPQGFRCLVCGGSHPLEIIEVIVESRAEADAVRNAEVMP